MATTSATLTKTSPIALPPLPWAEDALEPFISRNTIGFHYGKHHKTYVEKLNELIAGTPEADMPLEDIVRRTIGDPKKLEVLHNAQQTWNHTFYWNSMREAGGGEPPREIRRLIDDSFGGAEQFKEKLSTAAVDQFGSGWAWLVARGKKLEVITTSNAQTPITMGATPLLAIDVWEHAYYVDYENRRPDYVKAVIDRLLNWEFALQQLDKAELRKAA